MTVVTVADGAPSWFVVRYSAWMALNGVGYPAILTWMGRDLSTVPGEIWARGLVPKYT